MTLLGDRHDAEEATQDVILSVWRSSGAFDPLKARFSTWITHIAHNRAVDELRKRRKKARESPLENEPELEQLESQDSPSLEAGLEFYRIPNALDGLSPEHQKVIFLSFFQGYTHKEISEILKQPLGTVKTHMRSALKKLRESVGASAGETL